MAALLICSEGCEGLPLEVNSIKYFHPAERSQKAALWPCWEADKMGTASGSWVWVAGRLTDDTEGKRFTEVTSFGKKYTRRLHGVEYMGYAGTSIDGCLSLFCLGTPTCSRTLILHYLQPLLQDTAIGTSALQWVCPWRLVKIPGSRYCGARSKRNRLSAKISEDLHVNCLFLPCDSKGNKHEV